MSDIQGSKGKKNHSFPAQVRAHDRTDGDVHTHRRADDVGTFEDPHATSDHGPHAQANGAVRERLFF